MSAEGNCHGPATMMAPGARSVLTLGKSVQSKGESWQGMPALLLSKQSDFGWSIYARQMWLSNNRQSQCGTGKFFSIELRYKMLILWNWLVSHAGIIGSIIGGGGFLALIGVFLTLRGQRETKRLADERNRLERSLADERNRLALQERRRQFCVPLLI